MIKIISNTLLTLLSFIFALVLLVFYNIGVKVEKQKVSSNIAINISQSYNRFDSIMKYTLEWERGYQNYPTDIGNYSTDSVLCGTKYGISAIAYQDYYGYVTPDAMYHLDTLTAKYIYLEKFYKPMKISKIDDNALAHLIFDTYIAGPTTCRRILGKILDQKISNPIKLETINKINSYNSKDLFLAIWQLRYEHIINHSIKYPEFEKGWKNRLNKIKNLYYE